MAFFHKVPIFFFSRLWPNDKTARDACYRARQLARAWRCWIAKTEHTLPHSVPYEPWLFVFKTNKILLENWISKRKNKREIEINILKIVNEIEIKLTDVVRFYRFADQDFVGQSDGDGTRRDQIGLVAFGNVWHGRHQLVPLVVEDGRRIDIDFGHR